MTAGPIRARSGLGVRASAGSAPRPGEVITQTRFLVDRDTYQQPSPTLNAIAVVALQEYLAIPRLAWDIATLHEPEPWDEFFALADLPRAVGADFVVGGRRYGPFAHDFRRVGMAATTWDVDRALSRRGSRTRCSQSAALGGFVHNSCTRLTATA